MGNQPKTPDKPTSPAGSQGGDPPAVDPWDDIFDAVQDAERADLQSRDPHASVPLADLPRYDLDLHDRDPRVDRAFARGHYDKSRSGRRSGSRSNKL